MLRTEVCYCRVAGQTLLVYASHVHAKLVMQDSLNVTMCRAEQNSSGSNMLCSPCNKALSVNNTSWCCWGMDASQNVSDILLCAHSMKTKNVFACKQHCNCSLRHPQCAFYAPLCFTPICKSASLLRASQGHSHITGCLQYRSLPKPGKSTSLILIG